MTWATCRVYQDHVLRNISARQIQCDEIWSFVGAKQKHVNAGARGDGDVYTWTAMDADSKLMICWLVGRRSGEAARAFMADLAGRLANRVQLTTDGLTNAFSKKVENHAYAVDIHFMHYNFCRPHMTLTKAHPQHYPTTPAMAAGVADHAWTLEEVCALLDPSRKLGAVGL